RATAPDRLAPMARPPARALRARGPAPRSIVSSSNAFQAPPSLRAASPEGDRRAEMKGLAGRTELGVPEGPGAPGMVSVVIPTYNRAAYLGAAIESALSQT